MENTLGKKIPSFLNDRCFRRRRRERSEGKGRGEKGEGSRMRGMELRREGVKSGE